MLSDTERSEIEAEFPHYPDRRAVCIDAMKIVQRHRGWVWSPTSKHDKYFLVIAELVLTWVYEIRETTSGDIQLPLDGDADINRWQG